MVLTDAQLRKEVVWPNLNSHRRGRPENVAHVVVGERVGSPFVGNRRLLNAGGRSEASLRAEDGNQVVDDFDIGHAPIISNGPIIASPDLSEARRYFVAHNTNVSVGERIKSARKERGLTQAELAQALGLRSQSVISDLERGGLDNWPKHARKIASVLGRSREWFEQGMETSDEPPVTDANDDLPQVIEVPEYDVSLSAGGGFIVDRETTRRYWPLPRFLIEETLGLKRDAVTIQEVIGDSMFPTLHSGDYVLIDLSDRRLGLPGVFAVWDGDALVCKRVERIPGTGEVKIKSDNPLHSEYQVQADRVQVVGRVRWFTRRT